MKNQPELKRAPRGKRLLIFSESVEVWPVHCTDGHRCIQCYFTGKYGCAPRFWHRSSGFMLGGNLPGYPIQQSRGSYKSVQSLNDSMWKEGSETLADVRTAQPLIPIPDGGWTEETTEILQARRFFRRRQPWRHIDHTCEGCGYPYLALSHNPTNRYPKIRYRCLRCGKSYSLDRQEGIPQRAKIYLCELREQGFTFRETNERIFKIFKIRMSKKTYGGIVKEMGLPPRKSGWFGDKERHIATRLGKGTPERAKLYLKELREQGVSFKETKERIYKRMKVRISWATYWRIVKELGLPPRKKVKDDSKSLSPVSR